MTKVIKKNVAKKILKKELSKKTETYVPKEKEIKKRGLLFFSIAVLFVTLILFIGNGVFTGNKFNKAQNNISELEKKINIQKESFGETIEAFSNFQEVLRKEIFEKLSKSQEKTDNNTKNIQEYKNKFNTIDEFIKKTEILREESEKKQSLLEQYVENLYIQSIEQQIIQNNFFIEMFQEQIAYLQKQNKDIIKNRVNAPDFNLKEKKSQEKIQEKILETPVTEKEASKTNETSN